MSGQSTSMSSGTYYCRGTNRETWLTSRFLPFFASRAVTPRTKMIIVNTPHNPVGKVFTRHELEQIAAIAEEHNLLVMSDEVVSIVILYSFEDTQNTEDLPSTSQYDSLVFDGEEHVRIATLPGMWDRTVTVGSAGSTSISPSISGGTGHCNGPADYVSILSSSPQKCSPQPGGV